MPDRLFHRLLVGRDQERDRLGQALQDVSVGTPRLVVVAGEAGIGKTSLVERFAADAAESGDLVMSGPCVAFGSEGLPLAPIVAALRGLVREIGAEAVMSLLPDPSGLALLVPELGRADGSTPREAAESSQPHLLSLVVALLERLTTDRTVVLVIEDLHWADQSTVKLLDVLARTVRNARLLTVVTYRSDGIPRGHPLRSFLAELERVRGVRRIELGPLSRSQMSELVSARTGTTPSATVLDRIFDRSGGNPFFVEELVDAGETRLGQTLRNLLLARLHALPRSAQALVSAAAIGGRRVPHRLLAVVAKLPDGVLLEQLEQAVDSHVLVPEADGYGFRHALVWETVTDSLLPGERMRLHRAYATALENEPGLLPRDQLAATVAHHWFSAREPGKALPAMLHAATVAGTLHAYAEQHRLLMRSLRLLAQVPDTDVDRFDLVADAVRAAMRAGNPEAALKLVDLTLTETEPEADASRRATLLQHRARLLLDLGLDGALVAAEHAERLAPVGSRVRLSVLDVLAAALLRDGTATHARDVAAEAVGLAERFGDAAMQVAARTTLAQTLVSLGQHDAAVRELRRARPLAERAGDLTGLARIDLNLTATLWAVGRLEEATTSALAARDVTVQARLAHTLGGHIAAFGALSLQALGRWDEAEALLDTALELDLPGLFAAFPHVVRGDIAARRGDLEVATRHLAAARTALGGQDAQGGVPLALLKVEIALLERRLDEARLAAREALEIDHARGDDSYTWQLLTTAARVETYFRLRDRTFGEPGDDHLVEPLRRTADRLHTDAPPWRASAAQFAAELDAWEGVQPVDLQAASWCRVVAAWDTAGDPYHATHARLRAAEALLQAGARANASAMLAVAARDAQRLGAVPLRREIEALARMERVALDEVPGRTDEPRTRHPLDRLGLTPREAQVLHLLTRGHSNRQIAAELVISEKTASVHVSRILQKLSVTSRGQAAATAHRLRLFDEGPAAESTSK